MLVRLWLALAISLALTSSTKAWTNAQVDAFRAEVTLAADGRALVKVELGVRVLGGWLERFELATLGDEIADGQIASAELAMDDGRVVTPLVERRDGGVIVRFSKGDAPRRGLHRLIVRYESRLVPRSRGAGHVRYELWLDGFAQSLSRAEVIVRAPRGTSPLRDEGASSVPSVRAQGGQQEIVFAREPWPRATPWRLGLDIPTAIRSTTALEPPRRDLLGGMLLVLATLAWATLSRAAFRLHARRSGAALSPLLIRPSALSLGFLGLIALLAWHLSLALGSLALLVLGLLHVERVGTVHPSHDTQRLMGARAGTFRHLRELDAIDLRAARLRRLLEGLGPLALFDAVSLPGALLLTLLVNACWLWPSSMAAATPWASGVLALVPLFVACSRIRLPRSPEAQLVQLLKACGTAGALPCAFRLMAECDVHERIAEPRLRITAPARQAGLLLLEVRASSDRRARAVWLCATVTPGSPIEAWLTELWPASERRATAHPSRVELRFAAPDLGAALMRTFAALGEKSQAVVDHAAVRAA